MHEPELERDLAARIPALGPVRDPTSAAVQAQYEHNPYPRWLVPPDPPASTLGATLTRRFPGLQLPAGPEFKTALVAGCGTGFEPLLLARGEPPLGRPHKNGEGRRADWPDDLAEIVYTDHFGNAMTGLRAAMLSPNARLAAAGQLLERARTFSDRPPGSAFWYENSNGLAEIAVNQGRADRDLGLVIGSQVEIVS